MPDTFDPSLLSGYLDNELTTAETAVVKQALAQNAELRQELEDIRKLRAAIAALPLPPIQGDLVDGVRKRIEQQQVERLSPMVHGAPATLKMLLSFAVAACVLLAVGWTILQNRTIPQTVALDPNTEPNATQPLDQTLDQPPAESLPVADAMAPDAAVADAALAEAMIESPRSDEKISMQAVVRPRESDPVEPLNSYGGATPPAPMQRQVQPQSRMMLKTGRQGPPPAMAADATPAPLSADFAPPAADAAPQLAEAAPRMAEAAPQLADAAPLAIEQAPSMIPSVAPSMARSMAPANTRPRAMAVPAETAAGDSATAARPLQARYLLRRQLSEEPLANTARSVQSAAAPATAKPQLIVSTLRKDQLDAALQWWRDRVEVTPAARPQAAQAALDPATQVLAVAGDATTVTKLSADWVRYVEQIDGQTRLQPLAAPATPGAGMSKSGTPKPGTPESETAAADAVDAAAPDADADRQATANGMLAIEFRIVE